MKRLTISLLAFAFLASVSFPAAALNSSPEDLALQVKIEKRLERRGLDTDTAVQVMVEDGWATLAGNVETLRQANRAAELAEGTRGIRGVDSYLHITSFGRKDAEIRREIQNILDAELNTEVFDWVEAALAEGKVLLTGRVYNPVTQARIAKAVADVPGVWQLTNSVEILPVSAFDDELREQALVAIYTHPAFSDRAVQGTPSIHIVVANGEISLKGTVSTEVQARLAESLVRSGTTHFGVANEILVTRRVRS